MQKISCIFATLCVGLVLVSCDEGNIQDPSPAPSFAGRVFRLDANIVAADTWPSQYSVVMAGFAGDDQAVTQKHLPEDALGAISETMVLPDSLALQTVELCVTDRLRRRIFTYASADVASQSGDTVRLDAGAVTLSMFDYIQKNIFTSHCATCHRQGSSTTLELAEGLSRASLINHPANHESDGVRVVPGSVASSLLHRVLSGDLSTSVPFDHSQMLRPEELEIIDNWIRTISK